MEVLYDRIRGEDASGNLKNILDFVYLTSDASREAILNCIYLDVVIQAILNRYLLENRRYNASPVVVGAGFRHCKNGRSLK